MINPERYRKIDEIFQAALELDPLARVTYISQACSGDESLREEVESLLSAESEDWELIRTPAFNLVAPLLGNDQPELTEGDAIGHYRIISLLGVGGMGQVYLAEDTKLGRKVALKLLPTSYTQDESRLKRFQQEARSASALNHPNILTIFDILELEGRHFIVTEFIDGESLRRRLKEKQLNASECLDITMQIATALSAAHEAGIIHRDIKPENIMLRRDGLVKVLDFGLAKLTEQDDWNSGVETTTDPNLSSGLLLGTVTYMSPEQAQGLVVDQRSDIFSLGVVLYEMLMGQVPFKGKPTKALISAIVESQPPPLTRRQSAYFENDKLQQVITRALSKKKETRYQTAAELLKDLQSLKDWSLRSRFAKVSGAIRKHKAIATLASAILIVAVVGSSLALYKSFNNKTRVPFLNMKMTRLTAFGGATRPVISPDGKYVAYGRADGKAGSLWLKEVGTSNETQIVPTLTGSVRAMTFSTDSKQIYYLQLGSPTSAGLFQVPLHGGSPIRIPVEAPALSCSPDGKRFAYVKNNLDRGETVVMTASIEGSDHREVVKRQAPNHFSNGEISWSPDGNLIAVNGRTGGPEGYPRVIVVNIKEKTETALTSQRWAGLWGLSWLPDMTGLVVVARENSSSANQIWHISYPGGEARRITNDASSYMSVSLSADGRNLVTLQTETPLHIWVMPLEAYTSKISIDTTAGRRVSTNSFDGPGLSWMRDGRIVFSSKESGNRDIWIMDADGSDRRQLTTDPHTDHLPAASADGRYIFFASDRNGADHIWRMDLDGRNQKQLTNSGTERNPMCTRDGKWVVYSSWETGVATVSKIPIDGGTPTRLTDIASFFPVISQDGKLIAYHFLDPQTKKEMVGIISIEGGAPLRTVDAPSGSWGRLRWTADGHSFLYADSDTGNIWVWSLDKGKPELLTDFNIDGALSLDLSFDNKYIALARGTPTRDVVLISDFK